LYTFAAYIRHTALATTPLCYRGTLPRSTATYVCKANTIRHTFTLSLAATVAKQAPRALLLRHAIRCTPLHTFRFALASFGETAIRYGCARRSLRQPRYWYTGRRRNGSMLAPAAAAAQRRLLAGRKARVFF
jgi:hypothetical protein